MRRCRAGADVILDARPELQRRGDLDGVGELDKLLIGLDRRPRRRQLKLKPGIDVGPDPAEAQNVQLAAWKHTPGRRARLVVVFEFGGVLVTNGKNPKERQPAAQPRPPLVNLLRSLEVETLPPLVKDRGIGQI